MSDLKPCPVTQIQAYRAYEKLLEIMEDETDDQTEAFSAAYKALYWIANDYRAQPANEPCADCSGMVYRQTASGKIIPADAKCAVIEPPPCYQPDNDGCAYQIYGDNDDEPIDKCKACPLCYSDKVRHNANEPLPDHIGDVTEMVPLTIEQLKQMDGEPVYIVTLENQLENPPYWAIVGISKNDSRYQGGVTLYNKTQGDWGSIELYGKTWLAYAHKSGGEQDA